VQVPEECRPGGASGPARDDRRHLQGRIRARERRPASPSPPAVGRGTTGFRVPAVDYTNMTDGPPHPDPPRPGRPRLPHRDRQEGMGQRKTCVRGPDRMRGLTFPRPSRSRRSTGARSSSSTTARSSHAWPAETLHRRWWGHAQRAPLARGYLTPGSRRTPTVSTRARHSPPLADATRCGDLKPGETPVQVRANRPKPSTPWPECFTGQPALTRLAEPTRKITLSRPRCCGTSADVQRGRGLARVGRARGSGAAGTPEGGKPPPRPPTRHRDGDGQGKDLPSTIKNDH